MIKLTYFKNQKVAVLGLGRSGQIIAKTLLQNGAEVLAWDDFSKARAQAAENNIPIFDLKMADWSQINAFILSPGIPHTYPAPHPIALSARRNYLPPIGDIECFFLSDISAQVVGVTGTNGKSTTAALIAHLIESCHKETALGGNIGIPVFLLPLLKSTGVYVLELSSYQLELTPSLDLDVSVLLNISPDHLDRHGGIEGYANAKKRIFQNKKKHTKAVIGVDDPFCWEIFHQLQPMTTDMIPVSYRQHLEKGVWAMNGLLEDHTNPQNPAQLSFKKNRALKGKHNDQNAAAAYAALRLLGFSFQEIDQSKGFETFKGLPHRQEWVACVHNIDYINDSKATNTEAVARALETYSQKNEKDHTIYWIAGGRPKEKSLDILNPFWSKISKTFLIGEAENIFDKILNEKKIPYEACHTLENACAKATQQALQDNAPNPLILLSPACTSFDQFQDFEHRGDVFRNWVLAYAREKGC